MSNPKPSANLSNEGLSIDPPPTEKKSASTSGFRIYLIGAVIVWVGIAWSHSVSYSTIPEVRYTVLIMGTILALPPLAIHFLLQLGVRTLVPKFLPLSLRRKIFLFNPPAIILSTW